MDVRFKNIPLKSSGFTISVVFSGIFIADVSYIFFLGEHKETLFDEEAAFICKLYKALFELRVYLLENCLA